MTMPTRIAPAMTDEIFAGGGAMGDLMRAVDWSATPLGPVEGWPQSLRTSVSILLASGYPTYIAWGPEFVQFYNDAYRPILGLTKHPRAMGQRTRECFAEIWDFIGPMFDRVMTTGEATFLADQLLPLDRYGYVEECYFTFSYSAIRDETGGVGGVFVTVIETTDRVLGERRLRTLRELAALTSDARTGEEACERAATAVASNAADIPFALVYLLGPDGSEAILRGATGIEPGSALSPGVAPVQADADAGPNDGWPFARVSESGQPGLIRNLTSRFGSASAAEIVASPRPEAAVVMPITVTGQELPAGFFIAGISPSRALDDDYRAFFALVAGQIGAAIAEARAYEAERKRAVALAELDRAKTAFFSNVSHEFRTPLALMLGPVEDALGDSSHPLPSVQRERLAIAQRNARRLQRLVNALLDFSRIESGRIQATFEPVDLALLTAELASNFRSAVEQAGLRLIVDCPTLDEPVYVDREMWEKIVLNLLSNAFKFTFEGEIAVTLRAVGPNVELAVRDTGVGIPATETPHLFERFYRVRGARARTHEGTGIGLSLVRELVRLHGGAIAVDSEEDRGSAFVVTIPLGDAHLPADRIGAVRTLASTALEAGSLVEEALRWLPGDVLRDAPPPESTIPETTRTPGRFAPSNGAFLPGHILVVDDNADMRNYLRNLLRPYWTVDTAGDGVAALAAVRRRVPDLVLSDIMMPRMDGFELVRALRSDRRTESTPIILVSARAGEESTVEGLAAGADDYLTKPFHARELLARISANLQLARTRAEATRHEREHAGRLTRLAAAALAVNSSLSLDDTLRLVTEQAREIIGAHQAATNLVVDFDWARAITTVSLSDKYAAWRSFAEPPEGAGIYSVVCRYNRSMRLTQEELEAHPAWRSHGRHVADHPPMRGWLAAPLVRRDGKNLGVIQLSDKMEGEFTAEDEAILVQLAQLASVAIENARLFEHAEQAVLARDDLLSSVSHDLKNPLTGIKARAQLLRRRAARLPPEAQAMIDDGLLEIDEVSNRMTALIGELTDASQLHRDQPLALAQETTDLVALAREEIAYAQQTTDLHQIELITEHSALMGEWDVMRLSRVLANLLSNAIKYSPNGCEISLLVAVTTPLDETAGGQWATIAVTDHGLGIPADDLPHIFERFHRAANTAGRFPGTGIGLAGARQIMEDHGGRLTVESVEGEGSTFTMWLPLG